ncbi:hypothetical protein CRUP_033310 [Coryphaenoides rupestris]|nr:hypothetical protein CRUP_033310 [Coryphaenoides rupestris]
MSSMKIGELSREVVQIQGPHEGSAKPFVSYGPSVAGPSAGAPTWLSAEDRLGLKKKKKKNDSTMTQQDDWWQKTSP